MTTEQAAHDQEDEGRRRVFHILGPLYRRIALVSIVSYWLLVMFAPMDNPFDYFRALAMVTGVLNVVMTLAVIYAYNVATGAKASSLLPTHIMHIGIGYVLLVIASLSIMIDHWGRHLSLIGTPIAMLAYLFGLYGLHLMLTYQYVKELRSSTNTEK
jgi:hypothetical protein